jgi:hypothetical protein
VTNILEGRVQRTTDQVHVNVQLIKATLASIPDIALVELDAVLAQQLAVFLLKRASAMVLLLRLYVLQHSLEPTRAHRKRAISTLPNFARQFYPAAMRGMHTDYFTNRTCVRPHLSLSQRERMKVRVCFAVAPRVRTRLLAIRCRALGEPDDSRIATQRLDGEPEIPTAFDREFGPHGSYARRRPIR